MTLFRALPAALPLAPRTPPTTNATLASRVDVTGTLAIFFVVLDEPLSPYEPGQYVSVGVACDGQLVQRPYSIVALSDGGTRVELFLRRLPDGRLSNLLWALPLGARLHIGPARGLFGVDHGDTRPRLMIGTGTGVAPLLAMLAEGAARRDATPAVLIHGVSFHPELAYGQRIAGWVACGLPVAYLPTVSRPHERRNEGWVGPTGRAETQLERLLLAEPELVNATAYLCGNPDMIERCRAALLVAGVAPRDIHAEGFHAPMSVTHKVAQQGRSLGADGGSRAGATDRGTRI